LAGVEALSCAMASGHLSQLKSLELSCNNLSLRRHDGPVVGGYNGGRGVRGVAEALRYCPRLETLHLDDTDMCVPGASRNHTLTYIHYPR
jgi:hypothetical protein